MPPSRDDDLAEIDRLTEQLARANADLQMTRLILARTTVRLAQEVAKNHALSCAIEKLV